MFQALVSTASRVLNDLNRSFRRGRLPEMEPEAPVAPAGKYERLERVVLTDQVSRTIFEEYAEHRRSKRGEEETGWLLLGLRKQDEAIVLATLPAGTRRDAGMAHVQFDSNAQSLASRLVRQWERRLTSVGVVHTHPGRLRHPSNGDFQGDSLWVREHRGQDGVFGIGTADVTPRRGTSFAAQPKEHMQCLGDLCFSWYTLAVGDRQYRQLPVHLTLGPDLARPLHAVWETIEVHAEPLDRLWRQQANVVADLVSENHGPALAIKISLAEPGRKLVILLKGHDARYYLVDDNAVTEAKPNARTIDRGVYLVLAELAGKS